MVKDKIKNAVRVTLKVFGKRLTNYHSSAKPYDDGVAFLKTLSDHIDWIVDVGVADGTPDLTKSFPYKDFNYLLVEANPQFFPYLDSVTEKYPGTAIAEKCFCGESEGTVNFFVDSTGRGSSRYLIEGVKETIETNVHKLDTLCEKNNVKGSILLKIDVEGAEMEVLRGAEQVLKRCEFVVVESWINTENNESESSFLSLIEFMNQQSFVVFDFFGGHCYETGVLKMMDVVFVKKDSLYRLNYKQ